MPFIDLALPRAASGICWRYSDRRVPSPGPHRHAELEANLVFAGRARYLTGDAIQTVEPGSLLWLYPDEEHLLVEVDDDFDMWIMVFRTEELNIAGDARPPECCGGRADLMLARRLYERDRSDLNAHAIKLASGRHDDSAIRSGLGWWLALAWEAFGRASQPDKMKAHPAVLKATRILRQDPSMSLPDLARVTGISPSRLSHVFSSAIGQSLTEYRNVTRIEVAKELIENGHSLTNAAFDAGFGSYAQFYRIFKRYNGRSPSR